MSVQLVSARLDAPPELVRRLYARLCGAERRRASRFRFERDRRRFVVARARLRELLAQRLETRPESIEFAYGVNGKPRLAGPGARSGWRFNVSHCEDLALYAFSSAGEIGIDVEAVHALAEADDIAARLFSRREHETYRALAPRDRPLGFFRCWTRKEAFVKALGDGLCVPLAEVDVSAAPPGWRLHSFAPVPGFIAALAHRQ
jgi:4'-phosphopantetheinyl transferase